MLKKITELLLRVSMRRRVKDNFGEGVAYEPCAMQALSGLFSAGIIIMILGGIAMNFWTNIGGCIAISISLIFQALLLIVRINAVDLKGAYRWVRGSQRWHLLGSLCLCGYLWIANA